MSFGASTRTPRCRRPVRRILTAGAVGGLLFAAATACGSSGSGNGPTSSIGVGSAATVDGAATTTPGPVTTIDGDTGSTTAPDAGGSGTSSAPSVPETSSAGVGPLLVPSGTFLSSHRLSLHGGDAPSQARSVCTTSPGATCVITFARDGITRSLDTRTVDANGSVTWDWSPVEVGLTVGHWDVTVTAANGTETQRVVEAIGLDVV